MAVDVEELHKKEKCDSDDDDDDSLQIINIMIIL